MHQVEYRGRSWVIAHWRASVEYIHALYCQDQRRLRTRGDKYSLRVADLMRDDQGLLLRQSLEFLKKFDKDRASVDAMANAMRADMFVERRITAAPVAASSSTRSPVKAARSSSAGKPYITGHAAVFFNPADSGTSYELFPGLLERVAPTAFDSALRRGDVVAGLWNHNTDIVLGSTASGTMRLWKDLKGLRYEITPPESRGDVVEAIARGDVRGSSYAFRVLRQDFSTEGDNDIRTILDVELFDASPTTFPAFKSTTTTVGTRSTTPALDKRLRQIADRARFVSSLQ